MSESVDTLRPGLTARLLPVPEAGAAAEGPAFESVLVGMAPRLVPDTGDDIGVSAKWPTPAIARPETAFADGAPAPDFDVSPVLAVMGDADPTAPKVSANATKAPEPTPEDPTITVDPVVALAQVLPVSGAAPVATVPQIDAAPPRESLPPLSATGPNRADAQDVPRAGVGSDVTESARRVVQEGGFPEPEAGDPVGRAGGRPDPEQSEAAPAAERTITPPTALPITGQPQPPDAAEPPSVVPVAQTAPGAVRAAVRSDAGRVEPPPEVAPPDGAAPEAPLPPMVPQAGNPPQAAPAPPRPDSSTPPPSALLPFAQAAGSGVAPSAVPSPVSEAGGRSREIDDRIRIRVLAPDATAGRGAADSAAEPSARGQDRTADHSNQTAIGSEVEGEAPVAGDLVRPPGTSVPQVREPGPARLVPGRIESVALTEPRLVTEPDGRGRAAELPDPAELPARPSRNADVVGQAIGSESGLDLRGEAPTLPPQEVRGIQRPSEPAPTQPSPTAHAPPESGTKAAEQAVAALRSSPEGRIELRLSPDELGPVRLELSPGDGAITVQVAAERGETLELLRRNVDVLARDLRQAGYGDVRFQFGAQGGWSDGSAARQFHPHPGQAQAQVAPADGQAPSPVPATAVARAAGPASRGLDLRL